MNLTESGKSVKVAPNEVKFGSTWLWSSFSNLLRAYKIIVEIHTQQNPPHGFTVCRPPVILHERRKGQEPFMDLPLCASHQPSRITSSKPCVCNDPTPTIYVPPGPRPAMSALGPGCGQPRAAREPRLARSGHCSQQWPSAGHPILMQSRLFLTIRYRYII